MIAPKSLPVSLERSLLHHYHTMNAFLVKMSETFGETLHFPLSETYYALMWNTRRRTTGAHQGSLGSLDQKSDTYTSERWMR